MLGCSRVLSRISRNGSRRLPQQQQQQQQLHLHLHLLSDSLHKQWIPSLQSSFLSVNSSSRFWFSSSPEPSDKATGHSEGGQETVPKGRKNNSGDSKTLGENKDEGTSSDSDIESALSYDELVKLVSEKDELLSIKHKEVAVMQDKILRRYAEMEDIMDRTKREARNSEKFAIQNFAKSLLDVSDNLGRASSVVKQSFSKIDSSKDTSGAVPLLNTLLEGVEMTEKQLAKVFTTHHLEKYEPLNEQFDPNKHYAIFQIPDGSKPPGTVAAVLKAGYMFHDRILRPAEVGVTTEAVNTDTE